METLVFVLIISNLNLVLAEDKVAIDHAVAPAADRNLHTTQQTTDVLNDQLAESSQSITQVYGNAVASDSIKRTQDDTQHSAQLPQELTSIGHGIHLSNGLRSDVIALNPIKVVQSGLQQGYVQPQQTHQLYLQYPAQQIQIFGAQASPLQQTRDSEGPQALGYSSYVEHLSEKDEEELKSALKDGSVSDIKRLVPKSGISFKIYPNDKNPETQSSPVQSSLSAHFSVKNPAELSVLRHRIKGDVPSEVYPSPPLQELQQTHLGNPSGEQHRDSEYSQQLLQPQAQDQQGLNAHTVYYSQPGIQQTFPIVNEKSSSVVKPQFRINVAESNYNSQAAGSESHRNLKSPSKNSKQSFSALTNHKQWNPNDQTTGHLKAVNPSKPSQALHYAVDSSQTEDGKGLSHYQNNGGNAVAHSFDHYKAENSFVSASKLVPGNHPSDPYVGKASQKTFVGQFANAGNPDQKVVLNLLPEGAVGTKPGHVISQVAATAFPEVAFKSSHFAVTNSETARNSQHGSLPSIPTSSFIDTKNSHNFDHQKALEGSTPFDFKNAIDSSGSLIHQTNYVSPTTTDVHHVENLQEKPPLAYIIPKIPTPTAVVDNSINDAVAEAQPIKDFGGLLTHSPQLSYHSAAEASGKFYPHPQTFLWTSEYIKQGNALTPKDLHPQLLRLHLPKEEVYLKTPNVEYPVSVISHVSLPQQKQPPAFHYEFPFIKSFPQEFHFHPQTKTRVQANAINHFKPGQPLTIDWSLFKSGAANFGVSPLGVKPEVIPHVQDSGKKKIVPILVRKRKNRSNSKQEIGVVYGKVNANRRPKKPNQRQEKNVRGNLLSEASSNIQKLKEEGKNEFSVSASYKVDRSSKSS